MNRIQWVLLMLALSSFAAHAEPVAAPAKPQPAAQASVPSAKPAPAAQTASPGKSAQPVQASTATKPMSQQDRMRECNKQATGKKGAERKEFMKACLSRKA